MKKLLAVLLAIVMVLSMSAIAFAEEDAPAADAAPAFSLDAAFASIQNVIDQLMAALQGDILETIKGYIMNIVSSIENGFAPSAVLGAVGDLEGKLGTLNIGSDLLDYCKNLINTLKQKIKDFYMCDVETTCEETTAAAPADTGSSSIGIAAFAAVSVAAAAAYVCTRKKED